MTVSGILVLDKKAGVTSFDAVAIVRRRLRARRVGHAGTLDPGATGVLPILVGEATKLAPWLVDQDKEYVAGIRFGVTTDTHDIGGRVLAEAPVPALTREMLERACRPFVGRIRQTPPMYSAVHHEGRRLYELAREGIEVERRPREVVVHAIDVEDVHEATATLRVRCGKGTYVRALAADLGRALGSGGVVERLVRTRVGPFTLERAVTWAALTELPADALGALLLPPESALAAWVGVSLDGGAARRFTHGQAVDVTPLAAAAGTPVRVHDASGRLLGVGEVTPGAARVKPLRLLNADRPGTPVLPA
jgi:tRNA pseudouridine55 synthase